MAKRFQLQPLAQAIALGLPAGVATFTSVQVEAAQVLTLPSINSKLNTGGNISVTSPAVPNGTNGVFKSTPPITINRFSPSLGVLTQVDSTFTTSDISFTLGVVGKFESKIQTSSSQEHVIGQAGFVYSPGLAYNYSIGPGGSMIDLNCTVTNQTGCSVSQNVTSLKPQTFQASEPAKLDGYVGETGTVVVDEPYLYVLAKSDADGNPAISTASLKWSGIYTTSYSYLNHAAPSFSKTGLLTSLTLDFGNLQLGSASGLDWIINNPGGLNTVGLDFDSFSTNSLDAPKFNLGASLFSNFAQTGKTFTASLDTSQSGSFLADYVLHFSDADVGAASTRFNYDLNLILKGVVSAPVPLPSAWLLMGSTLGLLGWGARKRS